MFSALPHGGAEPSYLGLRRKGGKGGRREGRNGERNGERHS